MTGWILIIGSIVTVAAVAVAWQVVLPQVTTKLQFIGSAANAGTYSTPDGAKNALILGAILVVFATIINMLGVKIMARINNFGVIVELIGCHSAGHPPASSTSSAAPRSSRTRSAPVPGTRWGYFGAFLIGGIMSAYVMYGFDTAGTLAEETNDPRRAAPPAILRALGAAALIGGLLILFALMVGQEHPRQEHRPARPAVHHQAGARQHPGQHLPDRLRASRSPSAAWRCARPASGLLFSMARDGRLPFGSSLARVSGRARVPDHPGAVRRRLLAHRSLRSTSPTSQRS